MGDSGHRIDELQSCPCQFNALPAIARRWGRSRSTAATTATWCSTASGSRSCSSGRGRPRGAGPVPADRRRARQPGPARGGAEDHDWSGYRSVRDDVLRLRFDARAGVRSDLREDRFRRRCDARRGRIHVDGVFDLAGDPILNPVSGAEHRARIDLPHGFEYELAEIGSARRARKATFR